MKIKDVQTILDILHSYITRPGLPATDLDALYEIQRNVLNLPWHKEPKT